MSLNESIVEDAVLEWFGELDYVAEHGPHLAPGGPLSADAFGPPPRISVPSSPNLDMNTPNLSGCTCDLNKAKP